MIIVVGLLFFFYSLLIIYYWLTWRSIPLFEPGHVDLIQVSVIIPARNEEENIGALLVALQQQTYPAEKIQVIVVDDHSTDNTADIVRQFPVQLISLTDDGINSYKKKAIERGIEAAKGVLIITTDADCIPGKEWLSSLTAFKQASKSVFIAAPVVMQNNSSLLQLFQAMDFMILQGITAAAVSTKQLSMCNGANLAYEKEVFESVNGFAGIDTIASGDDMLLMHKISKQYPDGVHYIKCNKTIVSTQPMKTWGSFFQQRIRWASKATKYDDKKILPVLLLVYLFNLCFAVLAVAGFFNYHYWIYLGGLWLAKTIVELPFFISLSDFFNKKFSPVLFLFFQPLHIIYTMLSGFFGQLGKYEWKGRKVR